MLNAEDVDVQTGVQIVDSRGPMAPSSSKSSQVRLLVTNKNAEDYRNIWQRARQSHPPSSADCLYFIDDDEGYDEFLEQMGNICKQPVSRIFYIDSDNDEVPIDSEVELKEALKVIGERSKHDKFTPMRIISSTSMEKKKLKQVPKSKTSPQNLLDLGSAKGAKHRGNLLDLGSATGAKHRGSKKTAGKTKYSEPKMSQKLKATESAVSDLPVKDTSSAFSSLRLPDQEISQTWLENKLNQFKNELLADFKTLLEPYIQEQKKMSVLVSSLSEMRFEAKNDKFGSFSRHLESDHNYSAPRDAVNFQENNIGSKGHVESCEKNLLSSNGHEESCGIEESFTQCVYNLNDDENFSIYSGEFSVTDSDSDLEGTSIVDVPLPPCFNIIPPSEALQSRDVKKEYNEFKKRHNTTSRNNEEELKAQNDLCLGEVSVESTDCTNEAEEHHFDFDGCNDIYEESNDGCDDVCTKSVLLNEEFSTSEHLHKDPTKETKQSGRQDGQPTVCKNELEKSIKECTPSSKSGTSTPHVTILHDPTPESIAEQHKQIVAAAQRAAHQAKEAEESYLKLKVAQSALHTLNKEFVSTVDAHQENLAENVSSLLGTQPSPNRIPDPSGSVPHQVHEPIQRTKLWNEVGQVDHELNKWVQMCHKLLQEVSRKNTGFSRIPHSMNESPAVIANETLKELEKVHLKFREEVKMAVYEKFCEEVKMASAQSDGHIHQEQPACEQSPLTDPINILPQKLMKIISSTLNTTFNILGKISKLGIMNAPSSGPSDERKTAVPIEKPQPQQSSSISDATYGYQLRVSPYATYHWPERWPHHDLQSRVIRGAPTEVVGSESSTGYRLCPGVVPSSYGAMTSPLIWNQNLPAFPQTFGQTQLHPSWPVMCDAMTQHSQPYYVPQ